MTKKINNSRTTNIRKIDNTLYLRLPRTIINEKKIKEDEEFIALKVIGSDNIAFRRINPNINSNDIDGLKDGEWKMDFKQAYDMVNLDQTVSNLDKKMDLVWKYLNMDEILRQIQIQKENEIEKINVDVAGLTFKNKPEEPNKKEEDNLIVKDSLADAARKLMKMK
jgi:hypothetical protein